MIPDFGWISPFRGATFQSPASGFCIAQHCLLVKVPDPQELTASFLKDEREDDSCFKVGGKRACNPLTESDECSIRTVITNRIHIFFTC
ncbi:hypothetical protein JOQ06_025791 [Pogonophryne albipinna]|uniref:Uncharacterized protein n=1 Tax=Pogonophryne albipinna TaxID=1090488 RepID=A0AAD6AUA5_9TELE|nr:hypothetical protein JOQ06_025791 [Pogonophryne albipinna]